MAEPRLDRSITLHLRGDWGQANLHRVCGWLAQEIGDRSGPYSRSAIWNGRGGVDNALAVGRGEVDLALVTPTTFARMALTGQGPYKGEAFPELRALGTVPQTDRLVLAVRADQGLRSFDDLRKRQPALRIATSPDDGINHIGFAVHRIMDLAGISLEAWGGRYVEDERPFPCIQAVADGRADAVFYEAIMTTAWQKLANEHDLSFIPIEDGVLQQLEQEFGWPSAVLPAGYFRGLEEPLPCLDFSDFLIVARADMPDDIAELIAWCLVETRSKLEAQYQHISPERSPVTYPLDPKKLATTAIPLHPGARRYYASGGLLAS
ncbi:MAG: TAXI family TRAP transporter solute-binding subunit [Chloroflexota bacterium]|jgi:hypothetical protein